MASVEVVASVVVAASVDVAASDVVTSVDVGASEVVASDDVVSGTTVLIARSLPLNDLVLVKVSIKAQSPLELRNNAARQVSSSSHRSTQS